MKDTSKRTRINIKVLNSSGVPGTVYLTFEQEKNSISRLNLFSYAAAQSSQTLFNFKGTVASDGFLLIP